MFNHLKAYKEEHGDCFVTDSYDENPQLGRWVKRQRNNKGNLSNERIALLESIGFAWSGDRWPMRFEELKQYKEEHGDCLVPQDLLCKNQKLSKWVKFMRTSRRQGNLSQERIDALDDVGFVWDASIATYDKKWIEKFNLLKKYKAEHGHCRVPRQYPKNPSLADWVNRQRRMKRELSGNKIALLNGIEFVWHPQKDTWLTRFEQLKAYKKKYGDCKVPNKFPENPQLGNWVRQQRLQHRDGIIPDDRVALLNSIDFVWRCS